MNNFDWEKHLVEALEATDYCCLSTVDSENGTWANPVYFAWDEDFNVYFISLMESRHMQNISKDSRVSVAIYKTEQKGDVIGVQLEGEAKIVSDKDEKEKAVAFRTYYGRVGSLEQNEVFQHDPQWLFVKITPKHIYYFDSKVFGEKRQTVPLEQIT